MKSPTAKNQGVPLSRLAEMVGGEIQGPSAGLISGINSLREAGPGEITFLVNPRYAPELEKTRASAVIVGPQAPQTSKPVLLTANPYLAYARIAAFFAPLPDHPQGVSTLARVGEDCQVGGGVTVYPFVFIGNGVTLAEGVCLYPGVYLGDQVRIGRDSIVYPNVSILSGTTVGDRVIIHSGTVIGSDGYGFARDGERHIKIPQVGTVRIDDDCEIGANNTIDRAALGRTWIQSGVKTDNLVHIAHNVEVGENSLLIAQVGISGSAVIGRNVILAGQAGVAGHITVGDGVMVGGKSGVAKSIPAGQIVSGNPTMPHQTYLRTRMLIQRLPEMQQQIRTLEDRIRSLEAVIEKGRSAQHGDQS
ncbi:MAG TPA: UDP-3-O-(3-hydroxymyristoyl)glucosamine N-acyltransferase [Thermodesulfobacteriota bacterium]|nr:UDP-3-O-(3-hydroxymyristoyl)glucosamine N-acyltransferase [Thermodesulfobacteriota bacterium]